MTDLVLETHGLRKEYGPVTAVADLSLTVRRGEVFGFLGPNGAGKTTSLKMLLGLVRPTSGQATVLGGPLGDRARRARMGFLPEHFRFHDWLSGRELLRFHGGLLGIPAAQREARMETLLDRVDLTQAGDRNLREYSKGMLQRLGLAQALLGSPELVFLDEPTSGLDPIGRLLVRDVIDDLRGQGTSVFLNSHLLSEVEATCDRVAFIRNGRVVREMALSEEEAGVELELRVGRAGEGVLQELAAFGRDPLLRDGLITLRIDGEERIPELTRWLVGRGVDVYRIAARRRSLEDLFLEMMGGEARPG